MSADVESGRLWRGRKTVRYKASDGAPSGRCVEVSRDAFAAHTLCNHIITLPWSAADAVECPPTCPDCLRALNLETSR